MDFITAVVKAGYLNELRGAMPTDEWVISILIDRFNHLFAKVNISKLQVCVATVVEIVIHHNACTEICQCYWFAT